jgi:hypothetical protein
MENKKGLGIIGLVVLCLAVSAMFGVAYAAFTQNLTIEGKATVKTSNWKIEFQNLQSVEATGTAAEVTAPQIQTDTIKISEFNVSFSKPGDSVSYTFDVKNEGDYNAKVSSITVPTPTCTGTGANATTDASNVCKYLTYTLTYSDGTAINENDALNAGAKKTLKLSLSYNNSVNGTPISDSELPASTVNISNLTAVISYIQA